MFSYCYDNFDHCVLPISLESITTLPVALQKHIQQRNQSIDQAASTCAWQLLKMLLAKDGVCADDYLKDVVFSTSGKPYFSTHSHLHFNYSHSRAHVICALSQQPIGIDIEHIQPYDASILPDYFTAREQQYIQYADQPTLTFYELWTKKESFLKCTGQGITSIDLTQLEVLNEFIIQSGEKYIFHPLNLFDHGCVSYACVKAM